MKLPLLTFSLLALSVPSIAQETAVPPATPAPAPSAAPGRELVETEVLLKQIKSTYKTFKNYRCTFSVFSGPDELAELKGDLLFSWPNKMRLSLKRDGKTAFTVLDGLNIYQQQSATTYAKTPGSKDISSARQVLSGTAAFGTAVLANLFDAGDLPDLAGPYKSVPNADADRLVAHKSLNGRSMTVTLDFEPVTHFLKAAEISAQAGNRELYNRTDFDKVRKDLTIKWGTFKFNAPEGMSEATGDDAEALHDPRLKPGVAPFSFQAKDVKGQLQSPEKYKGKILLIDFWATWCGPCVASLPELKAVYAKYHSKGFEILGVSLDESKSDVLDFVKKEKITWAQVCNAKGWEDPISRKYGIVGIPCTFLVGRDGNILEINPEHGTLDKVVAAALKNK